MGFVSASGFVKISDFLFISGFAFTRGFSTASCLETEMNLTSSSSSSSNDDVEDEATDATVFDGGTVVTALVLNPLERPEAGVIGEGANGLGGGALDESANRPPEGLVVGVMFPCCKHLRNYEMLQN